MAELPRREEHVGRPPARGGGGAGGEGVQEQAEPDCSLPKTGKRGSRVWVARRGVRIKVPEWQACSPERPTTEAQGAGTGLHCGW